MGYLRRRAGAHLGLLSLVALLVAVVAATSGVMLGAVVASTTDAARTALAEPEPATLTVTTRVAPDAAAQDARVRDLVDEVFDGAPLDVARSETPDGTDTPFATWRVTPDLEAFTSGHAAGLAAGGDGLRTALREADGVAVRGVVVEGDLGERAAVVHAAQRDAGAVAAVPVVLLALTAVVALTQVARLLAATRETEAEILVARGAAPRQLTAAGLLEAAVVGVLASGAGTALAVGVLAVRGAAPTASVAWTGALTAVGSVVVLTAVVALQARAVARREVTDRSGRLRQVAALGTVVAAVALGAAGLLRLRTLGSPLVVVPDGARTDPLAAAAPALVLAALGVVVLALLGPGARLWSALAARGRGTTAVLAARQVARRLRVVVVGVVLLVLASGSAVLAGAYAGTSEQARADAIAQRVGTDVRVTVPAPGRLSAERPPPRADELAALDGVAAAAPALVADATVQGATVGLTALAADRVSAVVRTPDAAPLSAMLRGDDPFATAPSVPDDATGLVLALDASVTSDVDLQAPQELPTDVLEELEEAAATETIEVEVSAWLAAADGSLTVVEAGTTELPEGSSTASLTADLPAGVPPGARLVALDVGFDGVPWPRETALAVSVAATVPGGGASAEVPLEVSAAAWAPADIGSVRFETPADGTLGIDAVLDSNHASRLRLVATDPATPAATPVPAVVSEAAAQRWDLAMGDTVEATTAGSTVPLRVVGVTAAVPGQTHPEAALVDLATLDASLLRAAAQLPRPAEVWLAASDPDDAGAVERLAATARSAAAASAAEPQDVEVVTAGGGGVDAAAPVRLAFTLAAAGAAALAVVGLAVVAVAGLSGRRDEVVVLRAAGLGPRSQAAGRALEAAVVGVVALGAGILAGWSVAAATVPGLVGATLGSLAVGTAQPALVVDAGTVVALTGTAALGTAAVAAVVAVRVAVQARDTTYRPEVR
ncbi:FtsX-like permease family protein [Isoptericola sp. G70]|uniref:FtsX-like permease family protein n=1 Tax=Isoptericola sp. G70 TaxID=3376633 RepID=UPI003A7FEFF6